MVHRRQLLIFIYFSPWCLRGKTEDKRARDGKELPGQCGPCSQNAITGADVHSPFSVLKSAVAGITRDRPNDMAL